jgi:homoserine O-succinyltransferase/O-acetyltransferase
MPLMIESAPYRPSASLLRERRLQRGSRRDRGRRLRIGLVNNMPDSAVQATERQFSRLIESAAGDYDVRVTLVALDSVVREPIVREAMAETYRDGRQLRLSSPDAIIVTGAEPRAPRLPDEPYWDELTALLDWSRHGVKSALYSCLAAHAAAFHRDGIKRRRLLGKLSGVYESEVLVDHELTRGLKHTIAPHSRLNSLAECDLEFKGYLILTRSPEAGPDVFVRERDLLEVFWQGHPEYDRDTLAREYRRDMLRFLRGERPQAPRTPAHYFDPAALLRIEAAIANAGAADIEAVAAALDPEALSPATAIWRDAATGLMRNWLSAVARRKAQGQPAELATARWGG